MDHSHPLCIVSDQQETASSETVWSHDEDEPASMATDSIVRLSDATEHHPVGSMDHSHPLCIVSDQQETASSETVWSHDEDELASMATDSIVRLSDATEHHPDELASVATDSVVQLGDAAEHHPDELASVATDSTVRLWDRDAAEYHPDELASVATDSVVQLGDAAEHHPVGSVDHGIGYYDLRNTSRSLCIASGQQEAASSETDWSDDEDELAYAATDSILRLCDVTERHPVSTTVGVTRLIKETRSYCDSESSASQDFQGSPDGANSEASLASPRNFDDDEIHTLPPSSLSSVSACVSSIDYETDTLDFRGNPADKSKTGGGPAAAYILGVELAQRFCVVGVPANVFIFMRGHLKISSSESAKVVTTCIGVLNILAIFGGFLADAKLGRYKVIVLSAVISIIGLGLVSAETYLYTGLPGIGNLHKWILIVSLYIFATGVSGIKSCALGFGFEQFDESSPRALKAKSRFFNKFNRCLDIGSLFAITVLYSLQVKFGNSAYGIAICTGLMIAALVVLLCGKRSYRCRRPQGSPLTILCRVMLGAWKNKKMPYPEHHSLVNGQKKLRCLEKATIRDASRNINRVYATMRQVEDIKDVLKLIPIWVTSILFWTAYSQMNTFTIEQATVMNREYGVLKIPAIPFLVFLYFSGLVCSFLCERVFVRKGFTVLQKVGTGHVLGVVGMVVAGICENMRRRMASGHGGNMSAFWLIPQLGLLGAGEAFSYGQLEFFITEAPQKMKSMGSVFFLSTVGMGYLGSSFLVFVTNIATRQTWLKTDLNKGRLDIFYWMLAGMEFVNLLAFLYGSSRYTYRVKQADRTTGGENVDNV